MSWPEALATAINIVAIFAGLVLLVLTRRDVQEVSRHQAAMADLRQSMHDVRPLYSNLYTSEEAIGRLASDFLRDASHAISLGALSDLVNFERRAGESDDAFESRLAVNKPQSTEYVLETVKFITSGKAYTRILDLIPASTDEQSVFESLANVCFYLRMLESPGVGRNLTIIHHPDIRSGPGDFHFRVSDRQVVIRIGNYELESINSAITVTDTRVVEQFMLYCNALAEDPKARKMSHARLEEVKRLLSVSDIEGLRRFLNA